MGSSEGADRAGVPVVVVEAAERRCGLLSRDVREVQPAVRLVALPEAPAVIEGLFNLRGRIVPVISLRTRLGLPSRSVRASDRLVIVDVAARRLALEVDAAVDIADVPEPAIQPAPEALPEARYLAGVATLPDGLLLIQDLAAFLSAEEGLRLDAALASFDERTLR